LNNYVLGLITTCLAAVLISSGVFFRVYSTLKKTSIAIKILAIFFKISGFIILAYWVYVSQRDELITYIGFFVATYFVSFLLYLLARKVSVR